MNTVLFYSSVKNMKLFDTQFFYSIDRRILSEIGCKVNCTNDVKMFWKKRSYSFAFLYFFKKSVVPCVISRFLNKKVYITGGIDDLNRATTPYLKYLMQVLSFLICYLFSTKCLIVSKTDQVNIIKILKTDFLNKLVYIPHSLDLSIENFSATRKKEIFTTISWLENDSNFYRKGIDKAIILFSDIIKDKHFKNAKLYILGKGGKTNTTLNSLVHKKKIESNVVIMDEVSTEEKYRILSESKYYFQLSQYEGFGLAALEALYFKNLVIHSNQGGLKDTIGNYGMIYPIERNISVFIDELFLDHEEKIVEGYNNIVKNYVFNIRLNRIKKCILADHS